MKKYLKNVVAISVLGLSFSHVTYAEEIDNNFSEYSLNNIVVTANRIPVEEFRANASISVVTRDSIEKNHYANLQEALRDIPGVTVPSYGLSGEAYSANGLILNGTDNIVVLIDGVRANINGSAGTYGKMAMTEVANMDSIEKIEILKSSSSTLYGADAAGGVINIITRKPLRDKMRTHLAIQKGSFSKEQYAFSNNGGGKDGLYWNISLQKKNSGSFIDGRGREITEKVSSVNNVYKIGKYIGDDGNISLVYQTYQAEYLRPTGGFSDLVKDKKFKQFNTGNKNNSKITFNYKQKINSDLENTFSFFKNKHQQDELAWQKKHKKDAYEAPVHYHYNTIGFSDQITYRPNSEHSIVGGGEYYIDKTDKYDYAGTIFKNKKVKTYAIYVNDQYQFTPTWEVSYGIRYNHNSLFGNSWIPSVVLGNSPKQNINYFIGYKKFFIAPYMSQLYSPKYGDPNLKASTGKSFEGGINYRFTPKTLGMFKLFDRRTDDAFGYDVGKINPLSGNQGSYANYGKENARGFDVQLKTVLSTNWHFKASYTYTYLENITPNGKKVFNERVPRSAWNIGLNYLDKKFAGGLSTRAVIGKVGKMRGDNQKPITAPYHTYWVFDSTFNYEPEKDVNIFLKCSNLFNRLYTDQSYELNPDKSWYSAPGRRFELGVEYSF